MSLSHEQLQELSLLQDKYSSGDITKTQYDALKKEIFAEGKDIADNPSGNIIIAILILIGNIIRWVWRQGVSLSKFIHKEITKWSKKKEIPLWKIYTVLGILVGSILIGNIVYENRIESVKQAEIKATNDAKVAQDNAEKERIAQAKANTPKPIIEIQSPQENQGKRTTYMLKFTANNATNITVNGTNVTINGSGAYTQEIPLDTVETTITIVAKNTYHSTESSFLIARERNANDIAKEEKAKKDAEDKARKEKVAEVEAWVKENYFYIGHRCDDIIKGQLKAPKSAEFPTPSLDAITVSLQDGSILYISYVDAQNSFGAQIRTNYICTVEKSIQDGEVYLKTKAELVGQ